jgi:23S rRNA (cytidine1920-2'-O)/16S rRNA (cytidine1409-2'-O)-methyltransferase
MARRVTVNGQFVDKPGSAVHPDDALRIAELEHPWVGRGGMKLAHALEQFPIDVGYGQLDASLRNDPRVINREKVNARFLERSDFDEPIDFVSIDVSFISLKLILPAVAKFLRGELVALIKPQFEVGRGEVGKGGIVRDEAKRAAAVQSIADFARENGFDVRQLIESPVKGAEGNVEYLMYARFDV